MRKCLQMHFQGYPGVEWGVGRAVAVAVAENRHRLGLSRLFKYLKIH